MSADDQTQIVRTSVFVALGSTGLAGSVYAGNHYGNLAGFAVAMIVILGVLVYSAGRPDDYESKEVTSGER